ncbi:MAG TPA: hypothetical protein VFS24_05620 [Steroidobacteraceae bacterium]|nr:hypothetical protein [Steroidobacteraceae bacterium]
MRYFRFLSLLCALVSASAFAESSADTAPSKDSLRLYYARASDTDFVTVVAGDYNASRESDRLTGLNWGHEVGQHLFGKPIRMTANVGLQYIDERGLQPDAYGITSFIKAQYLWRLPWTNKRVQLGLGEGLSYVTRIPKSEERDFAKKNVESNKLMNYLEWTVDVPLSQFESLRPLLHGPIKEINTGFMVWHRSSVFGLFAETKGGINFMGFSVEARY